MSQPTLNNAKMPKTRQRNVRIGPVSLFALVALVCLSVLAVLAASTANATFVMSQRMADSTHAFYDDERAGQTLVAGVDGALGDARAAASGDEAALRAVEAALPGLCAAAEAEAGEGANVAASLDGRRLSAEITCHNGRMLKIEVTIMDDATYRIDEWEMTAVENEEQPTGNLWTGA
jgi:hypothetical protein